MDVARKIRPSLTQEEYDVMWDEFISLKMQYEGHTGEVS